MPQSISDYYGVPIEKAYELVSGLDIVHPYGKVGGLPWQGEKISVPFGSQNANIRSIAEGIKTFSQGLVDKALNEKIEKMLIEAEVVIFLRFAYHPINMELLSLKTDSERKKVYGTAFEASGNDIEVIKEQIINMLSPNNKTREQYRKYMQPTIVDTHCNTLFKGYFRTFRG